VWHYESYARTRPALALTRSRKRAGKCTLAKLKDPLAETSAPMTSEEVKYHVCVLPLSAEKAADAPLVTKQAALDILKSALVSGEDSERILYEHLGTAKTGDGIICYTHVDHPYILIEQKVAQKLVRMRYFIVEANAIAKYNKLCKNTANPMVLYKAIGGNWSEMLSRSITAAKLVKPRRRDSSDEDK